MATKTIVVLANSSKKGGRCLAGKEVHLSGGKIQGFGVWIRPISGGHMEVAGKSEGGQVTESTMRGCLGRAALPGLPENWEVAEGLPWRSVGMCPREWLAQMADKPTSLWDTSGRGWTKVDESLPKEAGFASLYLVTAQGALTAEAGSRNRTPGSVEQVRYKNLLLPYGGLTHEFRISDPAFDAEYAGQFPAIGAPSRQFVMPFGTYVTVSLTPAYSHNGQHPRFHYKMAAAIIKPVGT
jgi:hypothetical protein